MFSAVKGQRVTSTSNASAMALAIAAMTGPRLAPPAPSGG